MNQDSVKATPRNPVLGLIADVLAAAAAPQRTQQMQGIAKFFGLPVAARIADDLSYGGTLTSGKGMTAELKPDVKTVLGELLSNISPQGKAAAVGAGVIVPAMAAGAKRSDVKLAEQLIQAGNIEEAYKQFKIYADPTTGKLLKVIPDTNATLTPELLNTAAQITSDLGPTLPSRAEFMPPPGSTSVALQEFLQHPDLYKAVPDMADAVVGNQLGKSFGKYKPGPNEAAFLEPGVLSPAGDIALGPVLSEEAVNKNPVQQLISNLLHETQHGIQYWFGLPGGGTAEQFLASPGRIKTAQAAIDKLDKSKYATGWAETVLKGLQKEAFRRYELIPGEVQSRLVQRQFETGDYTTHPYVLMQRMGIDPAQLTPDYSAGQLLDLTPTVQNILDIYAPRGTTP